MKKVFTILSCLALTATTAWAQDYTEINRSNWEVTAYADPTSTIEGSYDGRAGAMLDGNTSTYFHSDWSCTTGQVDGGVNPGAFMVNMWQEETIDKIALTPREGEPVKNAPLKGRVYISEEPLVDLTALTTKTHLTALTQEALGEPTATFDWTWESSDAKTIVFESSVTGQYILFIADETHKTDANWLCVAEFQAYTASSTGGGGNEESELFTLTVDNASKVILFNENCEEHTLVNGDQKFSPGNYQIKSVTGYKIYKVTLNDVDQATNFANGTAYMLDIEANDKLVITAEYPDEEYSITFNDPAAIKSVTTTYNNGTQLAIAEIEGIYFTASNPGYKITVELNEGYTSESALQFYLTENVDIVTTVPSLFTLTVDNASKVILFNENCEEHTLVNGDQKFSPGNYQIKSVTGYKIYKVTLNGVVQATYFANGTVYLLSIEANDKLVITADYEDEDYSITFNDPAAIKSVTTAYNNGTQLDIGEIEGIYFTASYSGYKITVELNEGYTSESALQFYLTENVDIVTKAAQSTAIKNATAPAKAGITKTIENGRVVIIRDGERFDLTGRKL